MNEDPHQSGAAEPGAGVDAPEQVRTGVSRVDAVIAAIEQLEERPIEEHVGVFETAHEQLRRALDAQPEDEPTETPADPEADAGADAAGDGTA